jgi:hypothetical protein
MHEDILSNYIDIIDQTMKDAPTSLIEINNILDEIRSHIRGIKEEVFSQRNELLIAIRLVEAFRIYNWIKVCIACGSYQSVFRELRFMLDGIAQACYIDLNHVDASLQTKLEVYKALCDLGGFIGSALFDRLTGFTKKQDLKNLYSQLSLYVHPSINESRRWVDVRKHEELVDIMKFNKFDVELLNEVLTKCKDVGRMLISIDEYFNKEFLKIRDRN